MALLDAEGIDRFRPSAMFARVCEIETAQLVASLNSVKVRAPPHFASPSLSFCILHVSRQML